MKTMMIMKWDGVTSDQYDKVRKLVNWEEDLAEGGIFHVASFGGNALHVTDIWESAELFQDFLQKRLMPAVAEAGLAGQPHMELFPVHAIFVPDGGKLKM